MAFLYNTTTITSIPHRSFHSVLKVNKFNLMLSIKKWLEKEEKEEEKEKIQKNIFNLQLIDCMEYTDGNFIEAVEIKGLIIEDKLNDFDCFYILYSFFQHLLVELGQKKVIWTFQGTTHMISQKK